jgi:predicted HicB family RNase H-like nuclease
MSELNTLSFGQHSAVISFDPEIEMFRGEFVNLNGGADFYGASIDELKTEGARSLQNFMDVCRERGIDPIKKTAKGYNLRLDEGVQQAARVTARARGISLNKLIENVLRREVLGSGKVTVRAFRPAPTMAKAQSGEKAGFYKKAGKSAVTTKSSSNRGKPRMQG